MNHSIGDLSAVELLNKLAEIEARAVCFLTDINDLRAIVHGNNKRLGQLVQKSDALDDLRALRKEMQDTKEYMVLMEQRRAAEQCKTPGTPLVGREHWYSWRPRGTRHE